MGNSRKSAASAKVVKPEIKKQITEEEAIAALATEFDLMKDMYIKTLEIQIKNAGRVDNLLNVRDYSQRFWDGNPGACHISKYKKLVQVGIETYEKVLEASKGFELEEFMKPELKDYYESIVPRVDDIGDEEQLEEAGIVFMSVQPYGQKMMGMHQSVQQMMAELGIGEE